MNELLAAIVPPLVVAGVGGAVTLLARNLTGTQRLRRRLEKDSALLQALPDGPSRRLLQVAVDRDADDYAQRRVVGPYTAGVYVTRIMAGLALTTIFPLMVTSELTLQDVGASNVFTWISTFLAPVSMAAAFISLSALFQWIETGDRLTRLRAARVLAEGNAS